MITLRSLIVIVALVSVGKAQNHPFGTPTKLNDFPGQVVGAGDYDRDGNVDILAFTNDISWFKNQGDGTFNGPIASNITFTAYEKFVSLNDFDGDGDLDILALVNNDKSLKLYVNSNVPAKYAARTVASTTGDILGTTIGDFDEDGDLDIVYGDLGRGVLVMSKNRGDGTFEVGSTIMEANGRPGKLPALLRQLVTGDFNGDGKIEIAGNSSSGGRIWQVSNTLAGYVAEPMTVPFGSVRDRSLSVGDVDNDGDDDLVFGGTGEGPMPRFMGFLQIEDGFGTINKFFESDEQNMFFDNVIADFDNDGDLDVLRNGSNRGSLFYHEFDNGSYSGGGRNFFFESRVY